jgi:YD repeat-containing protein
MPTGGTTILAAPMTKLPLLAALMIAALAAEASAQQRTLYDSAGRVVGKSSTDSQGTTTNYDSRGRVTSRESTNADVAAFKRRKYQ